MGNIMDVVKFLQIHGFKKAKWAIEILIDTRNCWENLDIPQLRILVGSWEMTQIHGFDESKKIVANAPSDEHFYSWTLGNSGIRDKTVNIGQLRKAIADVESVGIEKA